MWTVVALKKIISTPDLIYLNKILLWAIKIHNQITQPSRILCSRKHSRDRLKFTLWDWRISKRKKQWSWKKERNPSIMNSKKDTKNNWQPKGSTRAPSSTTPEWKKCKIATSTHPFQLRNLLNIITAAELHLCEKIIANETSYRNLLKGLIVEGLVKML